MGNKVLIFATYTLYDPPIQNSIMSFLGKSWNVIAIQATGDIPQIFNNKEIKVYQINKLEWLKLPRIAKSIISWGIYWIKVRIVLYKEKPNLIVSEMHRPLSVIPKKMLSKTICFIPDIPDEKFAGKLDRFIVQYGWKQMKQCSFIWASDKYKAELTKEFAKLDFVPLICHNCPPLNYLEGIDKLKARQWLTNKLKDNEIIISSDSIILLRAGAVGPNGGIEETIQAIKKLPTDIIFVLMGKPDSYFLDKIKSLVNEFNLAKRILIIERPDDIEWKMVLLGADIGHLIHIRPNDNPSGAAVYDLNSSLSNNRLFQYMAAGLPIISYKDTRMNNMYAEVDCFRIVDPSRIIDDLSKICLELRNDVDLRLKMGGNGHNAFITNYHWEIQFNMVMEKIYYVE